MDLSPSDPFWSKATNQLDNVTHPMQNSRHLCPCRYGYVVHHKLGVEMLCPGQTPGVLGVLSNDVQVDLFVNDHA